MSVLEDQRLAGLMLLNACSDSYPSAERQARVIVAIGLMYINIDGAVKTLNEPDQIKVVKMLDDPAVRSFVRNFNYNFAG